MNIKGVIFDMDGLMFDTERLTFEIIRGTLADMGLEFSLDNYIKTIGMRSVEVAQSYRDLYGEDFDNDEMHKEAMRRFWKYTAENGVPVKKGLFELLDCLKQQNITTALATSTTEKSAREILKRANVLDYFDCLICGDAVKHGKPDPEIYVTAVNAIGQRAKDCIALEDSINGIKSAYLAGLKAIMVPDLLKPNDEIRPMLFALCDDLTQVIQYIK